ncbi:HigA family addiction module antitoxin, partial [Leptospira wolffii]|uniref:HigA family addiction module antitoxin n=1 Tax=Leptospira wolffii TaxID=409998 RepID=UPI001FEF64F8
MNKRKPTHPGEILLEDIIKPLGLTITEAAKDLGISRKTLSEIVNCKSPVTPEMAVRIASDKAKCGEAWSEGAQASRSVTPSR